MKPLYIKCFSILLFCFLALSTFAQNTIKGKITDQSGQPIPGVSVTEKGTRNATSSDGNGAFSINVKQGSTLIFSSVGLIPKEVIVGASSTLNVTLNEDAQSLGEVVVTALGIKKEKRNLGYAITEIKGSDLSSTNEVNPINALQGKATGVSIDQSAGGLAGNARILIRGNSTFGTNNQPIFVVDGVIIDNDVSTGARDFGNDIKNLNMDDFESVSILKGSSAAALYGLRAINGVVLITTKKGKLNKGLGISVSQSLNIQQPYKGPDFQNEFGGGTVGAFFTDTRDPGYKTGQDWETKVFPTNASGQPYIDPQKNRELENWGPRFANQQVLNYDGTMTTYKAVPNNYLDAFQTGKGYLTNIAIDGGTEKATFRFSYSRNQSEGFNLRNKLNKNAFSLRSTYKINDAISVDAGVDYSALRGENPPNLGLNNYIWIFPRNYDTKYWMQQAKYTSSLGGVPKVYDAAETNFVPGADYWFRLFENNYYQNEQMVRGRLTINAKLKDWVSVQAEGNFINLNTKNESKELGQGYNFTGSDNTSGGRYQLIQKSKQSYFLKMMALFNKEIAKDFSFNGFVGGEIQGYTQTLSDAQTDGGLVFPANYFLDNSRKPQISTGGTGARKTFNSIYASADFSYKNQLYLQATYRGDWSSALVYSNATGNPFFSYPAVSLSWIFSETFKMPQWFSFGKLRTNLTVLGGDVDAFVINPGYRLTGFSTAGGNNNPMLTYLVDANGQSFAVDKNIKPLRKIGKEIGAELKFFKNRLGLDATYYIDNNKNQGTYIPAAPETGVNNILVNAGNIQNSGIELSLTGTPVKNNNFEWNTTLTYSRNRNKIIELYGDIDYYALQNEGDANNDQIPFAKVGGAYGIIRTKIHSKSFQATDANGNPVASPNNGKTVLAWRSDARAAFPQRSNEWQDVGDINAKFRGSIDNTFRYKSFSLNVLVDAKIGGDMVVTSQRYGTHTGIFESSLQGRDKDHGGIVWTSKYDGKTYDDGIIPDGVFANGQTVTQANNTIVNVGGMTYQEAYEKGFVEPPHLPQYNYRLGSFSTAVGDYWVVENSWVSLRQVALNFQFSPAFAAKLKMSNLGISLIGRDLFYLYNSLPNNINPASNSTTKTSVNREDGFVPPMTRYFGLTLKAGF
jgi:iron complex outermembrane receptor protein